MVTKIPKGLSVDARRIWLKVTRGYRCLPSDLELLELALLNWDMAKRSREILEKEGTTFTDKGGTIRLHPEAIILKNSENTFSKCWRLLNFRESPQGTGRPSHRKVFEED